MTIRNRSGLGFLSFNPQPAAQANRRPADFFKRRWNWVCYAMPELENDAAAGGKSAAQFPLLFEARLNDRN